MLCLAPRSKIPTLPTVSLPKFKLPAVSAELSPIMSLASLTKLISESLSISCPIANILDPQSLRCFVIDLTSKPPLKGISYSFNQEVTDFSDLQDDGSYVNELPIAASIFGSLDS